MPRTEPIVVSVILPTYNRSGAVLDAIASVLVQSWPHLELIVVDDGSTDDTGDRLARVHDPRVQVVRRPNGGVSAARNAGIRHATGALVSFIDSDDLWERDKLQHEVAFLARHPEAGAVFADLAKHDGGIFVPSCMRDSPAFARLMARHAASGAAGHPAEDVVFSQREMYLCLLEEVPIFPSAFTVRRSILDMTGLFDESWTSWEDWELFLRISRVTRLGYIDRRLATLRISRDSLHRIDAERGRAAMARLLVRERAHARNDPEARARVQQGITDLHKHMAWRHLERSEPLRAAIACLRGFRLTGDPGLLARGAAALIPPHARRILERMVRGTSGAPPPLPTTWDG